MYRRDSELTATDMQPRREAGELKRAAASREIFAIFGVLACAVTLLVLSPPAPLLSSLFPVLP